MRCTPVLRPTLALLALTLAGCDSPAGRDDDGPRFPAPLALPVRGLGEVPERSTSELWVRGGWAYTGTHGTRNGVAGNVIKVWNVAGAAPVLVDSLVVREDHAPPPANAHVEGEPAAGPDRIGDVQVSDDGRLLVAATEGGPGAVVIYDLADPAHPTLLTHYHSASTEPGVHTAEVARVNGRLHAFLSVDPRRSTGTPARLVVLDLADPRRPVEVLSRTMGDPFVHDVFVRDGILFTALWDEGVAIWDIGGAGRGGTVSNPVRLSTVATEGGNAHNVWWLHDRATGSRRWLLVGQEEPGPDGTYRGDVHVVDVADLASPREVAFFRVEGAGAHNFSVDEGNGVLYAAFYNAGVRALDVRGDLSACTPAQRAPDGRCDLSLMQREAGRGLADAGRPVFVWGVHWQDGALYASDMRNGLWKLDAAALR